MLLECHPLGRLFLFILTVGLEEVAKGNYSPISPHCLQLDHQRIKEEQCLREDKENESRVGEGESKKVGY